MPEAAHQAFQEDGPDMCGLGKSMEERGLGPAAKVVSVSGDQVCAISGIQLTKHLGCGFAGNQIR